MAKVDEKVAAAPLVSGEETVLHSHALVIENRTDDPVTPVAGQIWLRTDL